MSNNKRTDNGRFASAHGMRKTRLYSVWCAMKERCNNPHNKRYARYGGRGIGVCEEWAEFEPFAAWAFSAGYCDGLTIDRIDNDKGYSPDNCRWLTRSEQNRNYSRNRMLSHDGQIKCLSDWANEYGINRATLAFRLKTGKSMEQALSQIDGRTLRWKKTISTNSIT